jgi:polysaccharide biosynthesis transport protein
VRRQAARLARPCDGGRIYLVTSSVPEEVKTTSAIALARTLAMSGTKTLLIDFDLRKPSIGAPAKSRLLMMLLGSAGPE